MTRPDPITPKEPGDPCPECGGPVTPMAVPEDCSCHMVSPCDPCLERDIECPACGWEPGAELAANTYAYPTEKTDD